MSHTQTRAIYITGGTGFVGSALTSAWLERAPENTVIIQTRDPERHANATQTSERVCYVTDYSQVDREIYGVVNLAGAPIADERWTDERKRVLEKSRVALTEALHAEVLNSKFHPQVVVSASAIGFYGTGDESVDESSSGGDGYASQLCRQWEGAAMRFEPMARLVILRLGVVIGDGGMLQKLMPLYKLGLGGPIADGRQWMSWIHRGDAVGIILAALDQQEMAGVYNACSPQPVRQQRFAKALGDALGRPAFIPTPGFVLKVVFGQMAQELLIEGQKVLPTRAQERGFDFRFPSIDQALKSVLEAA